MSPSYLLARHSGAGRNPVLVVILTVLNSGADQPVTFFCSSFRRRPGFQQRSWSSSSCSSFWRLSKAELVKTEHTLARHSGGSRNPALLADWRRAGSRPSPGWRA